MRIKDKRKESLINSKCQNCGSELMFNPEQNCLTCKYCETNYFLPKKNDDAVLTRQYSPDFHPNELNRFLQAYKCDNCGNVYYMTDEGVSKKCPNCGGSSCSMVEDAGLCADGIIPFKLSKQDASEKFRKYLKTKRGVPKVLKKLAENQKLMGVYIPVWNFSLNIYGVYSATASEIKKDSSGSYYSFPKPVFGEKFKRVKSLDQSASTVEDEVFLDLFDEDDYAGVIPYTPEYTYGYRVDAIDKSIHDYYHKIKSDAEYDLKKSLKRTVLNKYKEISDISVETRAEDVFFNFAYVPVYVNTFEHKKKVYKTYISGTTGKVIGKNPVSVAKIVGNVLKFLGAGAIIALIAYLLLKK